ncbi:carbonic anhydrase 2-like [Bolinopsis microptera]|uniref:carbonic anhydrase 2-like n=1 Tax=Bolinopsis microptera TaxID=2820187 RepID=UPI003078AF28
MILFLTLMEVISASNSGTQLDYSSQNHWGGVCTTGAAQSPINVPDPSSNVSVDSTTPFLSLPQNIVKMTNMNNANTMKYSVNPTGSYAKVPWMNNRMATLVQLHIHWGEPGARGSEHIIGGKAFAAEAHLVTSYTDSDGSTKYMVFARVFKLGDANNQVEQMLQGEATAGAARDIAQFDLSALYPSNAIKWVTYMGGLTTPPCSEIVHWVIVNKPLTISQNQLNRLRTTPLGNGNLHPMSRNWRNSQPLNGRQSTGYSRVM